MDDRVQKSYVAYFCKGPHFDMVRKEMQKVAAMLKASSIAHDHRDYITLPKLIKQKLRIQEPRRQSFRQSMRSMNRNR